MSYLNAAVSLGLVPVVVVLMVVLVWACCVDAGRGDR